MFEHEIPGHVKPVRADQYLCALFPQAKPHRIRAAFERRDVKCNGRRIVPGETVGPGDVLCVYADMAQTRMFPILYEDEHALVIEKPQGISMDEDAHGGDTVLAVVQRAFDARGRGEQAMLCHRLDHHTGGLVLMAKSALCLAQAEQAFEARTMQKAYTCRVVGTPPTYSKTLRAFLLKDAARARVRIISHPAPGALPVETRYAVLSSGAVSTLRVELITGRTHQIRAHLASVGLPILGDDLYGNRSANRIYKARRQQLWATELTLCFTGPLAYLDGKHFAVEAPFLPKT